MKDAKLTAKVKEFAYSIGADLVGIANIERFSNAPIMMSPQGILPSAKSVIVCAVHHPDACIELGGEPEPQDIGPYAVQYVMNDKLDVMSFKIARYLDDLGYKVAPIASSNIWRYRAYKELDAVFAPDMSHIYAAVAAGITELGWHGLSMSPEYGPRNRFVSIITDAELEPTPLYNGPKLCDMCGECIKHCPTDAYRKEVNGVKTIKIEDREYRFANKNLWRCAWGEHFDLDLNLEIPEKVTEQVIIENVKKHGLRGGEFGSCLRYCLPAHLRVSDPSYTRIYRRKRHFTPSDLPVHRSIKDKVTGIALNYNLDSIGFISEEKLSENSVDVLKHLPDGKSVVVLGIKFRIPESEITKEIVLRQYGPNAQFALNFAAYDICRELEKLGYTAIMKTSIDSKKLADICGFTKSMNETDLCEMYDVVITSANFPSSSFAVNEAKHPESKSELTLDVKTVAREAGADLVGVAPLNRVLNLMDQLKEVKENEETFVVKDKNPRFYKYDPIIDKKLRKLISPEEYVKGAKSVLVLGLHYPETVVERAAQPPAEAVGPYVFAQYQGLRTLGNIGFAVVKHLNNLGYKAAYTYDMFGLGSQIGSPRGLQYDNTCNSMEAVAAGLGELTYNGLVRTPQYGTNQRFIVIVTDADLQATEIQYSSETAKFCDNCMKCLNVCPTKALLKNKKVELNIEGAEVDYIPVNTNRCDWSSKYALCGDDGFKYIGSKTNILPPEVITAEALAEALTKVDPVQKYRPVTAECCIIYCPLANGGRE